MADLNSKELMARGYRRTSNAHGMVSRVDRPDWQEYMIDNNFPVDADFYRRVCSRDILTVSRSVARRVKTSNHDPIGFVSLEKQ